MANLECIGIKCENCEERYECDIYKAQIGFGEFNVSTDKRVKKRNIKSLEDYDKGDNKCQY